MEVVKILSTANSGNGENLGNSRKDKAKNQFLNWQIF
jgi:hypothetical protein